jgi:hypothetical protein
VKRSFKRFLKRLVVILLVVTALERFCYIQTGGFRLAKIFPFDWKQTGEQPLAPLPEELLQTLDQPLNFLGKGVQFYVFETADQKYVVKFFKHFHFGLSSENLNKIHALLPFYWIENVLKAREKRIQSIYSSSALAFRQYRSQTGLVYLHLQPTSSLNKTILIRDALKIEYSLDLDRIPFLIQKKAELPHPYFSRLLQEGNDTAAIEALQRLIRLIAERYHQNIANTDPVFKRNFGFINHDPIEIDTGSFIFNKNLKIDSYKNQQFFYEIQQLQSWIHDQFPNLEKTVEEALLAHLHLSSRDH